MPTPSEWLKTGNGYCFTLISSVYRSLHLHYKIRSDKVGFSSDPAPGKAFGRSDGLQEDGFVLHNHIQGRKELGIRRAGRGGSRELRLKQGGNGGGRTGADHCHSPRDEPSRIWGRDDVDILKDAGDKPLSLFPTRETFVGQKLEDRCDPEFEDQEGRIQNLIPGDPTLCGLEDDSEFRVQVAEPHELVVAVT